MGLESVFKYMVRDFKKIIAWQKADDLAVEVYCLTKSFPKDELYGLTSQIRRAAVSVSANIAEGSVRNHKNEYRQFLFIAKSSLTEVEYYLHLCKRLGYIDGASYQKCSQLQQEAAKVLQGLIACINKES